MKIKSILAVALALSVFGCAKPKPAYQPPPPEFVHTVQYQGETLASIAKWYTGSSNNWQAIRDVNPGLNPNKIRIGTDIQIPRELIVREAPLPKPQVSVAKKTDPANMPTDPNAQVPTEGQENYAAMEGNNQMPTDSNQGSPDQPMPDQYDEGTYSATDMQPPTGQNDEFAINEPTDGFSQPGMDNPNSDFSPPTEDPGNAGVTEDGKSPVGSFLGALGKAVSESKKEGEPGDPAAQ